PWVERYRSNMLPWPPASERIDRNNWKGALAQTHRAADWRSFFADELQDAPWRIVLDRWVARLAPGICASATHAVIRVGHAARSLAHEETRQRRQELADALASWAYAYQELPASPLAAQVTLRPDEAIARVALMPAESRRFSGTITSSLDGLSD